jgi:hypothetical protein
LEHPRNCQKLVKEDQNTKSWECDNIF